MNISLGLAVAGRAAPQTSHRENSLSCTFFSIITLRQCPLPIRRHRRHRLQQTAQTILVEDADTQLRFSEALLPGVLAGNHIGLLGHGPGHAALQPLRSPAVASSRLRVGGVPSTSFLPARMPEAGAATGSLSTQRRACAKAAMTSRLWASAGNRESGGPPPAPSGTAIKGRLVRLSRKLGSRPGNGGPDRFSGGLSPTLRMPASEDEPGGVVSRLFSMASTRLAADFSPIRSSPASAASFTAPGGRDQPDCAPSTADQLIDDLLAQPSISTARRLAEMQQACLHWARQNTSPQCGPLPRLTARHMGTAFRARVADALNRSEAGRIALRRSRIGPTASGITSPAQRTTTQSPLRTVLAVDLALVVQGRVGHHHTPTRPAPGGPPASRHRYAPHLHIDAERAGA